MKKRLKLIWLIIPVLLLLTGCSDAQLARVGNAAPEFELKNLDGEPVSLKSLQGKTVLLNFFGSWAPVSISEMSYLQQIQKEWSGKGLMVLPVSEDDSESEVKRFLQKHNLDLMVLLDTDRKVAMQYSTFAFPTSFVIDKYGIIRARKVGAFTSKEAIEKQLEKVIR